MEISDKVFAIMATGSTIISAICYMIVQIM